MSFVYWLLLNGSPRGGNKAHLNKPILPEQMDVVNEQVRLKNERVEDETSHRLIGRERSAAQCVFLLITGDSYLAVYLLHFTHPISPDHTCQHYIGWAESWPDRIATQRIGGEDAARLCQVAKERGIDFIVARIWPDGDRALERRLKNRHGAARFCPVCRGETALLPDVNFYLAVGAKRHLAQESAQK